MKEYADHVTEESQALTRRFDELSAKHIRHEQLEPSSNLIAESSGLLKAAEFVRDKLNSLSDTDAHSQIDADMLEGLNNRILDEAAARHQKARDAMQRFRELNR